MAPPLTARACQGDCANEAGCKTELADGETAEAVVVELLAALKRGVYW